MLPVSKKGSWYFTKGIPLVLLSLFLFVLPVTTLSAGTEKEMNPIRFKRLTNQNKTVIIKGKVTQTTRYCGGARPTQEMLDQMAIPVPYPNKKFYIRKGSTNDLACKVIKSFSTDSIGLFSIYLEPGTYSIILDEQVRALNLKDYKFANIVVDDKCLQEWWKKPYYILEVKDKNNVELDFIFNHACFIPKDIPCLTYTGPFPP